MTELKNPQYWLTKAATQLNQLAEQLDEGADPTEAFIQSFHDTKLVLSEQVSRSLAFEHTLSAMIAAAEEKKKMWRETEARLLKIRETFHSAVKATMVDNHDLPYKSQLGEIRLQRNSAARLEIGLDHRDVSVRHVVAHDLEHMQEYLKTVSYVCLDVEKIKADLTLGIEVPHCELIRDSHLRFK